jgi:hypothetical protein
VRSESNERFFQSLAPLGDLCDMNENKQATHDHVTAASLPNKQDPAAYAPLSDWQAECRNIEDKNQILDDLEQGVGSVECNRLVVGLMRKALVTQAKVAHAAIAAAQAAAAVAAAAAQAAAMHRSGRRTAALFKRAAG